MAVIETARFRLRPDAVVDEFVAANAELETVYVAAQPGFNVGSRRVSVGDDGVWTVNLRWDSSADAEASMAKFASAVGTERFIALIDSATLTMEWSTEIPAAASRKVANARGLYLEGIRDGHFRRAISTYTGDRYTQHSTGVRDGVDGFVEFFEPFMERNPKRDIEILRTIADGRYVFVHVVQWLNDGESRWVTMDLYDTDGNDRIIEHWDTIVALEGPTLSGHTQIDGATAITDLHLTEVNKRVVRRLLTEAIVAEPSVELSELISAETYIQHSLQAPDGLEGLQAFMAVVVESGQAMYYEKVHRIVGQGNFVAALAHVVVGGVHYAAFDLFRLENGLIVEHWDCVEPLPAEEELVNSGKF